VKTAIVITARLKSQRLPLKAIRPILGRPMIGQMIERLKQSKLADTIILSTSALTADDPLEHIAKQEKISCFRGHPEDVLVRMRDAARAFGVDTIISCTADNPFTDPHYIDELVKFHHEGDYDFSRLEGLPLGAFSYALSLEAVERACKLKSTTDTEMWGPWFTETGEFRCGMLGVDDAKVAWPELRLTVDTPEDFDMVSRIFGLLHDRGRAFSLEEVVSLCRKMPELPAMNSHVVQRTAPPLIR
jgi:spore coat polysaccharide biosynthesis protein SpsF